MISIDRENLQSHFSFDKFLALSASPCGRQCSSLPLKSVADDFVVLVSSSSDLSRTDIVFAPRASETKNFCSLNLCPAISLYMTVSRSQILSLSSMRQSPPMSLQPWNSFFVNQAFHSGRLICIPSSRIKDKSRRKKTRHKYTTHTGHAHLICLAIRYASEGRF
jgi:hypothetical protein